MRLKREILEELMYSGSPVPRFTQDTPVLPDVWIAYGEKPGEPQELLITPYQDSIGRRGVTAGTLCVALRGLLRLDHETAPATEGRRKVRSVESRVVYNQTTVFAELCFEELVRVVLPMSRWWGRLQVDEVFGRLRQPGVEAVATLAHSLETQDPTALFPAEDRPRNKRPPIADRGEGRPQDVIWMAQIIGTLAAAARRPEPANRRVAQWPPPTAIVRRPGGTPAAAERRALQEYFQEIARSLIDLFAPPALTPHNLEAEIRTLQESPHAALDGPKPSRLERMEEIEQLLLDTEGKVRERLVFSVSLNRPAIPAVSLSRAAVKADAAARLFGSSCRHLVWAVVDSGIDARHPAFRKREHLEEERRQNRQWLPIPEAELADASRIIATYDFTVFRRMMSTGLDPAAVAKEPRLAWLHARLQDKSLQEVIQDLQLALSRGRELDWGVIGEILRVPHAADYRPPAIEHGTHVAGILAAEWPDDPTASEPDEVYRGICPDLRIYDLRVLDDDGAGNEFNVIAALQFIRYVNAHKDVQVVNGVNLSLSIKHDVANYACGRTPVCNECERLVGAGVVVVAAAGNDGRLQFTTPRGVREDLYRSISITDPGNAEGVITVGATHRFQPHTYGVSYFSSRGPTADGRLKPDLVAPGERITAPALDGGYKELDGTSMAAPHVSGAAALLMARHSELIGQPLKIKQILCKAATDLGREHYFQGAGMVDVLRALQSV